VQTRRMNGNRKPPAKRRPVMKFLACAKCSAVNTCFWSRGIAAFHGTIFLHSSSHNVPNCSTSQNIAHTLTGPTCQNVSLPETGPDTVWGDHDVSIFHSLFYLVIEHPSVALALTIFRGYPAKTVFDCEYPMSSFCDEIRCRRQVVKRHSAN
jgi:hypothetical protein